MDGFHDDDFKVPMPRKKGKPLKAQGPPKVPSSGEHFASFNLQCKFTNPRDKRTPLVNGDPSNIQRRTKKRTAIRTNQRDDKQRNVGFVLKDEEATNEENSIIIGNSSASQPDTLTFGIAHPLLCLESSFISEKDFQTQKKSTPDQKKTKSVKKIQKGRFPKLSPADLKKQRYMQRLRQVVEVGDRKKKQFHDEKVKNSDTNMQTYELRRNELIWLELQAWYNDCTLSEQDQMLYNARQRLVFQVLSFVYDFHFDKKHLDRLNEIKTKIDSVQEELAETCQKCDVSFNASRSVANSFDSETLCMNETGSDEDVFSEETEEITTVNPKDSDNKEERLLNHDMLPDSQYMSSQKDAIGKVEEILRMLCVIENLYPSTSSLAREHEYYAESSFQGKVESLCSWFNIATDLRQKYMSYMRILFSNLSKPPSNPSYCDLSFLPESLSELSLHDAVRNHTNHLLKQKSVRSILITFLKKHFMSLCRAKTMMSPLYNTDETSEYAYQEELEIRGNSPQVLGRSQVVGENAGSLEKLDRFQADSSPRGSTVEGSSAQTIGETPNYERNLSMPSGELRELNEILSKIREILPEAEVRAFEDKINDDMNEIQIDSLFDVVAGIYGLPSIHPMYMFFPSILLAVMRHCIHLRLEQAMPFYHSGSSVNILTVKQLVLESKEMLDCGLIARKLFLFYLLDPKNAKYRDDCMKSLASYEADLNSLIATYLDFVNSLLFQMLCNLPHAPRCFQDILEQEWEFTNRIASSVELEIAISCTCTFINTSSDIVISTQHFLISATDALISSQNQEFNCTSPVDEMTCVTRQNGSYDRNQKKTPRKSQAGLLWYHRQRSESPHLSRQTSLSSNGASPIGSPIEMERQISTTSSSSSGSMPWMHHKSNVGHFENQRRHLFELSRAIRELFQETRERSIRILSFGKQLRKSLELSISFTFHRESSEYDVTCLCCAMLDSLSEDGFTHIDLERFVRPSQENNNNCNEGHELVDFNSYWLFVKYSPDTSNPSASNGHGNLTSEALNSIRNAMVCHLQPCAEMAQENVDLQHIVFVKKQTHIPGDARRQPGNSSSGNKNKKKKKQGHRGKVEVKAQSLCNGASYCSWNGVKLTDFDENDTDFEQFSEFLSKMSGFMDLDCDITVISAHRDDLGMTRKEFLNLLSHVAKVEVAQTSFIRNIKTEMNQFRNETLQFCTVLRDSIQKSISFLDDHADDIFRQGISRAGSTDMDSRQQVRSEVNEVMQSCFNFGFEFINEASRIMSGDFRKRMNRMHMEFSEQWIDYVMKHRDRGKGHRPRWASHGLSFLVSIDTDFIFGLSEIEFSKLQAKIDSFITYLIGEKPKTKSFSPLHRAAQSLNSLQVPPPQPQVLRSLSNSSSNAPNEIAVSVEDRRYRSSRGELKLNQSPIERVRLVISEMESKIDERRYDEKSIGRVSDVAREVPIVNLGVRTVNFRWQRGTKVGEGGFGRVFTCVNLDTGTILAMKVVKFQANDHQKIRSALDEFTNFEGIKHPNLVQYFGVELHREEMYIFMEYCEGGTLDECKISLPEMIIRRYTAQILGAVNVLHMKGIVHRDIKGSNIFLTSSGVAKLGDFGSALRLKDSYQTTPGEIISHIGTTMAYTAPEVINSSDRVGYGRAADIWSLGCVVIEMASGKKPWHDLESFQIMFKVGSGVSPDIPDCLSEEGKHFTQVCTIADPKRRWTTEELTGHAFVKVASFDEL